MEIAFCRIDDRLIHGQVATVWSKITGCNRIMCCNDDVARVREEEQRLERRVFRVLVRFASFLDRHDVRLEARRRDLQQQLLAQRVLRDVVVAAHNAVAARNLRPNGRDLAVNQTIVDAAECDFHDVCSPFAGSR